MKTLSRLVGITGVGLLACSFLTSCACRHENNMYGFTFLPGPVISGGVTYYPAKPGATYHNTPVDYTTNPPPAGVVTFVTVFSTKGLVIDLIDGDTIPDTNSGGIHFINTKSDGRGDFSTNRSSQFSDFY